jgi:hypothetical protein
MVRRPASTARPVAFFPGDLPIEKRGHQFPLDPGSGRRRWRTDDGIAALPIRLDRAL